MKLIIAGSRSISPAEFSKGIEISKLAKKATIVISGTAKGADQLGESWAAANGLKMDKYSQKIMACTFGGPPGRVNR